MINNSMAVVQHKLTRFPTTQENTGTNIIAKIDKVRLKKEEMDKEKSVLSKYKKVKRAGGCCILKCKYNCQIFGLPSGKRVRGECTKAWRKAMIAQLYKYRVADEDFKRKIDGGTAKICAIHFKEECIVRCVTLSWLKVGSLPTEKMPQKNKSLHRTRRQKPKGEIIKFVKEPALKCQNSNIDEICEQEYLTPVEIAEEHYPTLLDFKKKFKNIKTEWKIIEPFENRITFLLFHHNFVNAARQIDIIADMPNCRLSIHGKPVSNFGERINLSNIEDVLKSAAELHLCEGYEEYVCDKSWGEFNLQYTDGLLKKRYYHKACLVGVPTEGMICSKCRYNHFDMEYKKQLSLEREKEMRHKPVSLKAKNLSACSESRLHATIKDLRKRLRVSHGLIRAELGSNVVVKNSGMTSITTINNVLLD